MKSLDAHRARALLGARAQLVGMTTRLSNHIRGVLKTFGMLPGAMRGLPFDRRVEELLAGRDDLAPIVRPMLAARRQLREQVAVFDKAVRALAKADPTCRLLMSVPGIGVLSVLAYVSTVEDPARFARSRLVGAHMGLTPRQYQSGEVDRSGRISKRGDTLARTLLYEAAVVLLTRQHLRTPASLRLRAQEKRVRHGRGEYARDEDGDGFCEVHINTMEGFWSLLRSWLRPHPGISQDKLPLYLGFLRLVHNAHRRGKALLGDLIADLVA